MSNSENYTDTGRTKVFYDGMQYGIEKERERWFEWLERLRTWYPEKAQTYHEGIMLERTYIIQYLEERIDDLLACHKDDDCNTMAHVMQGIIDDINQEAHSNIKGGQK